MRDAFISAAPSRLRRRARWCWRRSRRVDWQKHWRYQRRERRGLCARRPGPMRRERWCTAPSPPSDETTRRPDDGMCGNREKGGQRTARARGTIADPARAGTATAGCRCSTTHHPHAARRARAQHKLDLLATCMKLTPTPAHAGAAQEEALPLLLRSRQPIFLTQNTHAICSGCFNIHCSKVCSVQLDQGSDQTVVPQTFTRPGHTEAAFGTIGATLSSSKHLRK